MLFHNTYYLLGLHITSFLRSASFHNRVSLVNVLSVLFCLSTARSASPALQTRLERYTVGALTSAGIHFTRLPSLSAMSSVQQEQAGNNHSTADLLTEWFHYCANVESITEDGVRRQVDEFVQHEQLRHVEERNGYLPIHSAAGIGKKSPEFCRRLLASYPESAFITASQNWPLHWACMCGTLDTMKFFYNLCPDGVDIIAGEHGTPVHLAIARLGLNDNILRESLPGILPDNPTTAVEMIKFLLDSNPNIAHEEFIMTCFRFRELPSWQRIRP
eukprot:scaffold5190_cov92-Skeletonema_dohrnii-CCMP3373.AAC.4